SGGRISGDGVAEVSDRHSGLVVVVVERRASPEALLACFRPVRGVEAVQDGEKVGNVDGERRSVRWWIEAGDLAVEPPVHRPDAGEDAVARFALRHDLRDGQRELRPQDRQPPTLLPESEHVPDVTPPT